MATEKNEPGRVENINKRKGYYYYFEDDKILEYMQLTTAEKLQWLEDILEFTDMFLTEEDKIFREKLRRAEI
ncbi:hypothetical protein KAU33_14320 [Candidatus Dependentiae bacterium]|nr:hypothetical protein [Candidatus Dependentiae bacterium]